MAFNFGNAPAPAPGGAGGFGFGSLGPAPAPSTGAPAPGGGFSFGGSTTASAPGAPASAPAPAGGFSFGGSAPAPAAGNAPAPAPAGGFGSTPAPGAPASAPAGFSLSGSAPASAPGAPAPAGGFSFGGSTPAPGAAPPAPAGGFGFGGSTPAPAPGTPAPAPAGGFGGSAPSPAPGGSFGFGGSAPAPAPGAPALASNLLQVPEFASAFPNIEIWTKVQRLKGKLNSSQPDQARLSGQELIYVLQCQQGSIGSTLVQPKVVSFTGPDNALRQRLQQQPMVMLPGNREAPLTANMFKEVLDLSTDLGISEANAIALYAESNQSEVASLIQDSIIDQAWGRPPSTKAMSTKKVARELYFFERSCALKSLLFLLQSRLSNNPVLLEATDALIQNNVVTNLISLIREWSNRIFQIEQDLQSQKENTSMSTTCKPPKPGYAKVHLLHAQQERQTAVECLFYLAYHTQLTAQEVGGLLDLIRDLTNGLHATDGLVALDPFVDVPAGVEPATPTLAGWNFPGFPAASKDKPDLQWQRELVMRTWNSGRPHLLNCVSPLILAVVCALDTQHELMDRNLHGPNAFGRGNQFLPPRDTSMNGLQDIHSRLNPDAHESWKRKDIWGLLAASYALLLRSAPSILSSPRAGAPRPSIDVRSASIDCFELPAELKSFSFARLTLVPALQRLNTNTTVEICDNSEFFLAVLSEFVSKYLNTLVDSGDMPISRQRWEKEVEEELKLRRTQQAQQQQFQVWSGTSTELEEAIPASVDLMRRPDCLDDVVALCVIVCSLGEEYAQLFWSRNGDGLAPSRALQELERIQATDHSVLPCYLSFLAALGTFEQGATAVHQLLSRTPDAADASTNISLVTWSSLMSTLRWYARELSPVDYDSVTAASAKSSSSSTRGTANTAYYYNAESNATSGSRTAQQSSGEASSSSTSTPGKPKELGEQNKVILSSHLAVLMNVASKSAFARCAILSIKLPIGTGAAAAAGGDETLLVLFSLAIAPLSPELRGAAFAAIACLLQINGATTEQRHQLREMALNGWEFLESCQILPIAMLDQYQQPAVLGSQERRPGLTFPPSSSTLAGSGEASAVLPVDPNNGIVFEMEHVESRMGWYPATEGFCKLLTSLVSAAGCPAKLGQAWRLRTGCSPYIEFVVDFVLPRASGSNRSTDMSCLPFRVMGDQSRLVSQALSVVEAVVTRYSVPQALLKNKTVDLSSILGVQSIVDSVVLPSEEQDEKLFADDYLNKSVSQYQPSESSAVGQFGGPASNISSSTAPSGANIPAVPLPKAPGFAILADILSSGGGNIFHALALTLVDNHAQGGKGSVSGVEADQAALTYALFGGTPPTLSSAKAGVKNGTPTMPLQTLLKPILPALNLSLIDATAFDNAVFWREQSIILALRILCAVAAREESFYSAVVSARDPLKIVPVLRFQKKRLGSAGFRVVDVQLSRLTNLLFSAQFASEIRSSIVEYIGYSASNVKNDMDIATAALSLVFFTHQSMPSRHSLNALCGNVAGSEKLLSQSVAKRLLVSSKRPESGPDAQVISLVLNWILSDLRSVSVEDNSLAQVLLGLPSSTGGGNWKPGSAHHTGKPLDCFDAVLELLNDMEYVTGPTTSGTAAFCFEIIYRLYDLLKSGDQQALRLVLYTAERLRSIEFWRTNILSLLSDRGEYGTSLLHTAATERSTGDENLLHSIAWLLKAVSCELRLLVGFANTSRPESGLSSDLAGLLSPRPMQCEALLSLLFGSPEVLAKCIIDCAPLERTAIDPTLPVPSKAALRSAASPLLGPLDVVDGYEQVSGSKLVKNMKSENPAATEDSLRKWAQEWNESAAWDCAASHLSNAFNILMGLALTSSQSLRSHALCTGVSAFGEGNPDRVVALQPNGLTNMLVLILGRLLSEGSSDRQRGMDGMLFPSATRNFSSTVLLLSESIVSIDESHHHIPNGADIVTVCALLARTVAFSGLGNDSSLEAPLMHERTAVLGSSLTILLRSVAGSEPDLISQHSEELIVAAETLSRLSSFKVDASSSQSHAVVAILSRSSLCSLMEACSDDGITAREQSFVFNVLSQAFRKSLVDLMAKMDENVSTLLQTIALQKFGADILLQSGIFGALMAAADTYLTEERRVLAQLEGPRAAYQKVSLRPPPYLMGHLRLLSALMSSPHLSMGQRSDISIHALQILKRYSGIIQRLCNNFPSDGDVLRLFMTCLVQASSLSQPVASADNRPLVPGQVSDFKRIFAEGDFLKNGIIMLCVQLSENPLPQELLVPLPYGLREDSKFVASNIVNISTGKDKLSWWNVLDELLATKDSQFSFGAPVEQRGYGSWGVDAANKQWGELKFEYAIVAIDILMLGLSLVKRSGAMEMIERISFARGLCHCASAATLIEQRLIAVQNSRTLDADDAMETEEGMNRHLELEYLTLLSTKLGRCVEELLVIALMRLRLLKEDGRERQPFEEFSKLVSIALDHSGVETKGIGCLAFSSDSSSEFELLSHVCKQIRKEMK